jgi:hypothetical protein
MGWQGNSDALNDVDFGDGTVINKYVSCSGNAQSSISNQPRSA